jgi:hypothetical protein
MSLTYEKEAALFDLIYTWGNDPCPVTRAAANHALDTARVLNLRWLDRITLVDLSDGPPLLLIDLEDT